MTNTLLWLIFIELTVGLILGGYVLYEIQTALAVIVLRECADTPPMSSGLVITDTVRPDVIEPEVLDDTDTTGTFTGAAWK